MNATVNYSTFVNLLFNSDDDFEPYGMSAPLTLAGIRGNRPEVFTRQEPKYFDEMDRLFHD